MGNIIGSIFYNASSWHELITNGIKPFLNQYQDDISAYSIYLSANRGDHIILEVKPTGNKEDLQQKLSVWINQFLKESPSVVKDVKYPVESLFMDYPCNTAWFDIENIADFPGAEQSSKNINQQISRALIEALGNEEIEIDSICTFFIYMQIGVIKAAFPDIKNAGDKIIDLLHYLEKIENADDGLAIRKNENVNLLFENTEGVLLEIIEDTWKSDNYGPELKWMETWVANCKLFLEGSDFKPSFIVISKLVCKHIGLTNKKITYLSSKAILNTLISTFMNSSLKPIDK